MHSQYEWTAQKKNLATRKDPMSGDTLHCLQRHRIKLNISG